MAESDRTKWDERYATGVDVRRDPPAWLREVENELPKTGRALDVAAGAGRVAIWLARRGLEVVAVDISDVGLSMAREVAREELVALSTVQRDLEKEQLPDGPFDVISVFHYRQQDLFPQYRELLRPGGVLLVELTTVRNLERSPHPSRRFLAEPNEVLRDCQGLELVYYREGWFGEHSLARAVARKPRNH